MIKFFLFLLSFSLKLHAYTYDLAVLAIFQNEAKYLPEWIEFHHRQGVEHFYLYNNNSQDHYLQALAPYLQSGLVDLTEWPYGTEEDSNWNTVQCSAYNHCIERISNQVNWLAILDTDEFLFNPHFVDLRTILYFYEGFPGVTAHWVMYGTSQVDNIPQGQHMLDQLLYRAHLGNNHCKSIVRPHLVEHIANPHFAYYKNAILGVNENKKELKPAHYCTDNSPFSANILRINHYWSRDLEFFHNVKFARRQKWGQNCDTLIQWESEMNQVYDPILLHR